MYLSESYRKVDSFFRNTQIAGNSAGDTIIYFKRLLIGPGNGRKTVLGTKINSL